MPGLTSVVVLLGIIGQNSLIRVWSFEKCKTYGVHIGAPREATAIPFQAIFTGYKGDDPMTPVDPGTRGQLTHH